MKSLVIIVLISTGFYFNGHKPAITVAPDAIMGTWWNAEKNARIRVFLAVNGKYAGKIEWLKEPNDASGNPKTDPMNPNKKLRSNPRLGLAILKNFVFNNKSNRWEDGTVYDPNNGKTYDGYLYFDGNQTDKLSLRGYILGMSMLGRTSAWERFK